MEIYCRVLNLKHIKESKLIFKYISTEVEHNDCCSSLLLEEEIKREEYFIKRNKIDIDDEIRPAPSKTFGSKVKAYFF